MSTNYLQSAQELLERVRELKPLVHHITNYVTVNDCANILLGAGASPVMADEAAEVEEIVAISGALVINIGTLNKRTIEAMFMAGKKANELGIPVILDPVGAGASILRTETAKRLVSEIKFAVIRGNISEIKTIAGGGGITRGVDADVTDAISENNVAAVQGLAAGLAAELGSVIAITGAVDVISDGKVNYLIKNGHPMMARVTGTGCMCSSLIGAFCGANSNYTAAAAAAVMAMGLAGEKAYVRMETARLGNASFRNFILDEINLMTGEDLVKGGKISFE